MTTQHSQSQTEPFPGQTYPETTYAERIGCGILYVTVINHDDKFHRLFMKSEASKTCDCGESWLQAMSGVLTFGIRRALKEGNLDLAILKQLRNHRCNRYSIATAKSCSDAIYKILDKHFKPSPKNPTSHQLTHHKV